MSDDEEVIADDSPKEETIESEETEQTKAVEDTEKQEDKEPQAEIEEEPVVRRSVREHILARKLKKAVKETHEELSAEEEELTPAGRKAIQQEVAPLIDLVRKQADDVELNAVFSKYPEARAMEKQIRKHMEVYENTPAEFIYQALAAKSGKFSSEKAKADADAKAGRTGGSTKRQKEETGIKSAWDMTDAEFDASVAKVMSGR